MCKKELDISCRVETSEVPSRLLTHNSVLDAESMFLEKKTRLYHNSSQLKSYT